MAPLIAHRPQRHVRGSFEGVYRAHVRDVYAFALSMVGNVEDAEDVAQTTFLNAYRALERGERVRNLRAWLLAIAHNVCRQRFRTAARRPRQVELDPEAAEAFVDDDAPSAQEIRHAMGELSFNHRTILVLREIEGLTYEEIAEAMGLSLSAVETLLFRARQALREQLEAAEHDLGCDAIQRLISLQLDGQLARRDKGLLRAHLRTCAECTRFARSQRARKRVMPSLLAVPLPVGLSGAFEAGGVGGATLVTSKVAALAVSAALVGTGALVETGVIPVPRKSNEARTAPGATAADAAAVREPSSAASPVEFPRAGTQVRTAGSGSAPVPREEKVRSGARTSAGAQTGPASGQTEPVSDSAVAGGTGGGSQSASPAGTSQSSSSPSGGGTGLPELAGGAGVPTPPTVSAPADPVGSVTDAVGGVESNIPPPPTSPVQTPSLPSVSVPDTGSLP